MSLEQDYFDRIYSKDSLIDGDYNAKSHARYLYSLLSLVEVEVSSLLDFGFGKGELLKECIKLFKPGKAYGIDSSKYIFDHLKSKQWVKSSENLFLENTEIDLYKFPKKPVDLGICNSVLQYVEDEKLETSVERMSYACRYLYVHVPSQEDYQRLSTDIDFQDSWATARPDQVYRDILSTYCVKVGWGVWESRTNVEPGGTAFFDSLYRD